MFASIRSALLSDLDIITSYNVAMAFETEQGKILERDVVNLGVRKVLENDPVTGGAMFFVAEVDGEVVGQCMVTKEWSDWRCSCIWWIQSVYVSPGHRRKGMFSLLYSHVKSTALAAQACGLRLYADDQNSKAHATYEELGMTSHYKVFEDMF